MTMALVPQKWTTFQARKHKVKIGLNRYFPFIDDLVSSLAVCIGFVIVVIKDINVTICGFLPTITKLRQNLCSIQTLENLSDCNDTDAKFLYDLELHPT